MSHSNDAELAKKAQSLMIDWANVRTKIDKLDKDAWHKAKSDAQIKKTKWYQSASSIGPQIDKVKASSKSFSQKVSVDAYMSLLKNLETLEKECKDFWAKHKEAQQDPSVKKALDDYAKVAKDAYLALAKHVNDIKAISAAVGAKNIAATGIP